ncbi:MAG: dTMP kinase [Euryarchaeota archaeon]|nr:dTMP kinase [Euryarchaeota archaeon]
MLIALEGIDGSGKSTQARLLARWLQSRGVRVHLTSEPTQGEIGRLLRRMLRRAELLGRTEALLFAADRSEHVREIQEVLASGSVVVTEYVYSSFAYQSASGVELEWLRAVNSFAPDAELVLCLDLPASLALARIGGQRRLTGEHYEREGFLERVRRAYLELAEHYENFEVVDATRSIREVHADIVG